MTYFCTLASGSSGNCAVYVNGRQRILADAGRNTRYIADQLRRLGLGTADLTHIVVTHSHSDHVSALPVLLKHSGATLVCSVDTYSALAGRLPSDVPKLLFEEGEAFLLGDCPVRTFATSHDAPGSCGYVLGTGEEQVALCTDMGTMNGQIFETIRGSRAVLLEFNHDVELLKKGSYPYPLKVRILSEQGHLSNGFSAKVAARLCQNGTRHIVLAHLSAENNRPELALAAAQAALAAEGLAARLTVAPRDSLGEPILL